MHNLASVAFRWETFANKFERTLTDGIGNVGKRRGSLCQAMTFVTPSGESTMRLLIALAMVLF